MTLTEDIRLNAIHSWLVTVLKISQFSLAPASNDASFRRYFRVKTANEHFIVMDAPPDKEPLTTFITVAELLEKHRVNVPHIYAEDREKGFLLLTDFGQTAYLDVLKTDTAPQLYLAAIKSLITLQKIPTESADLPHYNRIRLHDELVLFDQWFLQRHLNLAAPDFLTDIYSLLIDNAISQPQVVVHRDFHSRNIMYQPDQTPGIIDFQDAVIGPITYDLVSIFRDAYIAWPAQQVEAWLEQYCQLAEQAGLITQEQFAHFTEWFDLMGLQRHLKILGIFCRLNYRDNKPNYLKDLKLTLHYVMMVCQRYPQLSILSEYLNSQPSIQDIL